MGYGLAYGLQGLGQALQVIGGAKADEKKMAFAQQLEKERIAAQEQRELDREDRQYQKELKRVGAPKLEMSEDDTSGELVYRNMNGDVVKREPASASVLAAAKQDNKKDALGIDAIMANIAQSKASTEATRQRISREPAEWSLENRYKNAQIDNLSSRADARQDAARKEPTVEEQADMLVDNYRDLAAEYKEQGVTATEFRQLALDVAKKARVNHAAGQKGQDVRAIFRAALKEVPDLKAQYAAKKKGK